MGNKETKSKRNEYDINYARRYDQQQYNNRGSGTGNGSYYNYNAPTNNNSGTGSSIIGPNDQQFVSNQSMNYNQNNYNNNNPYYNNNQNPNNDVNYINDPIMVIINKANKLFVQGNQHIKEFSFQEALICLEECQSLINQVYPKIDDEMFRAKIDHFISGLNSQIDFANFQAKNKFEFKKNAGFAKKEDKEKPDFSESIKKAFNEPKFVIKDTENKGNSRRNNSNYNSNEDDSVSNANNNNQNNNKSTTNNTNTSANAKSDKVYGDLKERITNEIIDHSPGIKFSDVIGLDLAKQILREIIVLPNLRPDLFVGLRSPPKGLLLFGPPGVGKTMIAKAVATECNCTFFSISASSLTSKYLGESEKLVRSLFELAYERQPSVVFIDEIESILSKRSDGENDATKRLKTEFLVQFDGVGSDSSAKILVIGATNRPQELDSAVIRRLPKRIYIPPFNETERFDFIKTTMKNNDNNITDEEYALIAKFTDFYSNSDLKELCREAVYEPIREIKDINQINNIRSLRAIQYMDFVKASKMVRGSLNKRMLEELNEWNSSYGAIN